MEVVGTVAATVQLVGLAMSILDSIAQLHDIINLVPDRYQRWHTELDVLGTTINCIQQDSALHTLQVNQVLENMSPKIKSLLRLCRRYTPPANASRIIKAIKILSAHAVEPRITEYLQSLEHDKTTLLLAIQLIPAMSSSMKDLCFKDDATYHYGPGDSHKAHTKDFPRKNSGDMGSDNSVSFVEPTGLTMFQDNKNVQPFKQMINARAFRFVAQRETLLAGAEESSSSGHAVPNPSTTHGVHQSGDFSGIRITGQRPHIGHDSRGINVTVKGSFTDFEINGDDARIGHRGQNQDPSSDGLRGGGQEGAAKRGSDTMVLDEQFADERDEDRMDLDP
ncbi:hypothetical protein GGR58DRAFT_276574 [Xylaria digitata]|nr:hypothetical protein GGR58DRAFT_276574 [Xylaria digitata]